MNQLERLLQKKTNSFMRSLYMHDTDEAVHMMDVDAILAGPGPETLYSGIEEIRGYLDGFADRSEDTVLVKEYQCIASERDIGMISLIYTAIKKEGKGIYNRHVSVFWSKKGEEWKIVHIHLNDINNLGEGKVMVQGGHGSTYLLLPDEIMFIEARNMYSEIHCRTQVITAHEQLSSIHGRLPSNFLKIHRSYLVNICYVEKVERYRVRLNNGSVLPVPEKKYKDVEEKIKVLIKGKACNQSGTE